METKYLYLGLMLLSLAYPLAQSFEKRIQYFRKWSFLFPSIVVMMLLFIPWDIAFTHQGVWWFNDTYLTGIRLFLLPIEEWFFFIIVPFACVFLYEVLNHFIKKDFFAPISNWLFSIVTIALIVFGIIHFDKLYTSLTFFSTAIALILFILFNPRWKGRFLQMYILSWLPFLLVNGALTGNFTKEAVVNYNQDEFMGFRITTIPLEDSVYSLLMLLIVVSVYEWLKHRSKRQNVE